jgi:hypothetical protein
LALSKHHQIDLSYVAQGQEVEVRAKVSEGLEPVVIGFLNPKTRVLTLDQRGINTVFAMRIKLDTGINVAKVDS